MPLGIFTKELKAGFEGMFVHLHSWQRYSQQTTAEATQVSTDRGRDKQNGVYPHNRILCSFKRDVNPDTCCNVGEPWEHYAK